MLGASEGSTREVLNIIGLKEAYNNLEKVEKNENYDDEYYASTKIKYKKFKNEMTKYMTEEIFDKKFK